MNRPWWDASVVFAQFRLCLIREDSTSRMQQVLTEQTFAQRFQEVLLQAALAGSREEAQAQVQRWLYSQQYKPNQTFPAPRMWHLLQPLLTEPERNPGRASERRSPHTPLARARSPHTPHLRTRSPHTPLWHPNSTSLPQQSRPAKHSPHTPLSRSLERSPHTPLSRSLERSPHTSPPTRSPHTPGPARPSIQTIQTPHPTSARISPFTPQPKPGMPSPFTPQPERAPVPTVYTPPGMPSIRKEEEKQAYSAPQPTPPAVAEDPERKSSEKRPGRFRRRKASGATSEEASNTGSGRKPRRGLPSSISLMAVPSPGSPIETSEAPETQPLSPVCQWDTDVLLNQLRLVLVRERNAAAIRRYLAEPRFSARFQQALQRFATASSLSEGKEQVRGWVSRQAQASPDFPAQLLWSHLKTAFASMSQPSEPTAQPTVTTTAPAEQASFQHKRRVIPRHKKSLRKRRSSLHLTAVHDPEMVASLAGTSVAEEPPTLAPVQTPKRAVSPAKETSPSALVEARKEFPFQEELNELLQQFPAGACAEPDYERYDLLAPQPEPARPPSGIRTWFVQQKEQIQTRHLVILLVLVVVGLMIGLDYNPFASSGPQGEPINAAQYQKYLPISRVYARKSTISLVLQRKWRQSMSPQQLEVRLLKLKPLLNKHNVTRVVVFTRRGQELLVLQLNTPF